MMKASRSAQKRCFPSPVCFGALHWCFAESGCHGDKSINPRGFPNDWQKHTFNPLQGYYNGMTRRGVIELLYFPLFCRTCWGGSLDSNWIISFPLCDPSSAVMQLQFLPLRACQNYFMHKLLQSKWRPPCQILIGRDVFTLTWPAQ